MTVVFHTLSLGGVAVYGFFLISGYLITNSFFSAPNIFAYLTRRVLRIYPAFVVAFLLSVLVVAPLVGGHIGGPLDGLARLVLLQPPPHYPGLLTGLPVPALNGSMWTIAYEFRCYLLIAVLGLSGLLARRRLMLALTALAIAAAFAATFPAVQAGLAALDARLHARELIGETSQTVQLTAVFLIGACIYNYRDLVVSNARGSIALICFLAMAPMLFFSHLALIALTTLGAYSLFWLAFKANLGVFQRINDRWDISYGVYLYGWPTGTLILWFNRGIDPWVLAATAVPAAMILGAMSWWGLERWTKDLGRRAARGRASRLASLAIDRP